ncbi:hypothetical protein CANARDRAFT_29117 [[Candida] arabinofermentans NRRL YB-2248]|uniref:Uncharacterized protein n=1 Tax=[Candida] arabinofermentans NRRL YB-2248 TaxID=983967 RepID=A0A1E4SYQ6_9ASCO|nr:hypothetical protein CANARDRAFT_29117 [[Candida] arabinofermentans NRRL YB-2248]
MSWRQQDLVSSTGYCKKLNQVDSLFNVNNILLKDLVSKSIKKYNISNLELKQASELSKFGSGSGSGSGGYYRVIESLCHYTRDWTNQGSVEIQPLITYFKNQLISTNVDFKNTIAIVPGSGLGRMSHELTKLNFKKVHAIEYSWLMVLFNEFVYANENEVDEKICSKPNTYKIHPYIHNYSNQLSNDLQFRSVEFEQLNMKPNNLTIHKHDFNHFDITKYHTKEELPPNILILTCFFLDTAENLIDYFDSINRICDNFKGSKTWINVGPLKYGTAAKCELNYQELKSVRDKMGWETISEDEDSGDVDVLGYLTDEESLWRGYYGVTKWTCIKK